ncbi:MAG: bifunctional diaminohydroxyphosphoribosylaminopyrimidine deaminase/5-amino-6-(5-phosphoribosylamino)uracil reductase RibD [Micrococcaceae bacterium]
MSRISDIDDAMDRALTLARRSPEVGPDNQNPPVGCVLIDSAGRIVAEGWHRGVGTAHAEVDALAQLRSTQQSSLDPADLTAVVTLEPCNHHGRTGPCAQALLDAGIGAVAYGASDPGEESSGGAQRLLRAGVTVIPRIQEQRCEGMLNAWLASRAESPTAAVVVKWAQSWDGRAAAEDGSSQWITSREARADVHHQRARADFIVVGTGTLLADDPALTARDSDGGLLVPPEQQPVPVVIGHRSIPEDAMVRRHPALAARGLETPIQLAGDDLADDLGVLVARGGPAARIFVEGGPRLASSVLRVGLATEVLVYTAPLLLGGPYTAVDALGVSTVAHPLRLQPLSERRLGPDVVLHAAVRTPGAGAIAGEHSRTEHKGVHRVHRTR